MDFNYEAVARVLNANHATIEIVLDMADEFEMTGFIRRKFIFDSSRLLAADVARQLDNITKWVDTA